MFTANRHYYRHKVFDIPIFPVPVTIVMCVHKIPKQIVLCDCSFQNYPVYAKLNVLFSDPMITPCIKLLGIDPRYIELDSFRMARKSDVSGGL